MDFNKNTLSPTKKDILLYAFVAVTVANSIQAEFCTLLPKLYGHQQWRSRAMTLASGA
jgi:hypothetical protein